MYLGSVERRKGGVLIGFKEVGLFALANFS